MPLANSYASTVGAIFNVGEYDNDTKYNGFITDGTIFHSSYELPAMTHFASLNTDFENFQDDLVFE